MNNNQHSLFFIHCQRLKTWVISPGQVRLTAGPAALRALAKKIHVLQVNTSLRKNYTVLYTGLHTLAQEESTSSRDVEQETRFQESRAPDTSRKQPRKLSSHYPAVLHITLPHVLHTNQAQIPRNKIHWYNLQCVAIWSISSRYNISVALFILILRRTISSYVCRKPTRQFTRRLE